MENNYLEKLKLLPQLTNDKWEIAYNYYDKNADENGLIVSCKYLLVDKNYEIVFDSDFQNINQKKKIIQHRLIKIDGIYFQVVDYYYTRQNFGIIQSINEDQFNEIENTINNVHGRITKAFKLSCININTNKSYYFIVTIQYHEDEKEQECYIELYYPY